MQPEAPQTAADVWSANVAAAVLRRGGMVHTASLVLTAAGAVFLARHGLAWLVIGGATVILGIVEFWLAARAALDAELFDAIAAKAADLDGFDRAMGGLGLMPLDKAKRPLNVRIQAAFRLLKLQALALGLQVGALVIGALWA
jgi:hypothetical protein